MLCTDFASRLEERRKVKSAAYYERKKAVRRTLATAKKEANVDESVKEELAKYGY
jgi:large subunit ribosomal protein L13Ae